VDQLVVWMVYFYLVLHALHVLVEPQVVRALKLQLHVNLDIHYKIQFALHVEVKQLHVLGHMQLDVILVILLMLEHVLNVQLVLLHVKVQQKLLHVVILTSEILLITFVFHVELMPNNVLQLYLLHHVNLNSMFQLMVRVNLVQIIMLINVQKTQLLHV